jgi:predicted site-specific integrase-resolvase
MSETKVPKRLITLQQAARRLGVRPGTLYRWKCAGQHLSFYKVIGGVKLDPDEIDQMIARSRITPTANA